MPTVAQIKKGLRQLPYLEMKALATDLEDGIGNIKGPRSIHKLADVLASLPEVDGDGELELEQELLARFFNRKRNISIATMQQKGRWKITMGGNTPVVPCTNIRDGIIEFLELLVAQVALEED